MPQGPPHDPRFNRTAAVGTRCTRCGFDLRDLPMIPATGEVTCPECGTRNMPHMLHLSGRRYRWMMWLPVLVLTLPVSWLIGWIAYYVLAGFAWLSGGGAAIAIGAVIFLFIVLAITYLLCYAAMRIRSGRFGSSRRRRADLLRSVWVWMIIVVINIALTYAILTSIVTL